MEEIVGGLHPTVEQLDDNGNSDIFFKKHPQKWPLYIEANSEEWINEVQVYSESIKMFQREV